MKVFEILKQYQVECSEPEDFSFQLKIPLTQEEWLACCMDNGAYYVGGCCAQTSAIQDQINSWLRASGWVSLSSLADMAQMWLNHDDENWEAEFELLSHLEFQQLEPWERICHLWTLVKDLEKPGPPRQNKDSETERDVSVIANISSQLSWAHLFDDTDPQHQFHNIMLYAKMIPPLKRLVHNIESSPLEPQGCFAIFDQTSGDIAINRGGYCIYETEEEAKKVLNYWKNIQELDIDNYQLRPAIISVQNGLEWRSE